MSNKPANRFKPASVLSGSIAYNSVGPVGLIEFQMDSELFQSRNLEILKADLENVVRAHCPAAQVIHWRVIGSFTAADEF